MSVAAPTHRLLDDYVAAVDADTLQRVVVVATPDQTYTAIWDADLLSLPFARQPKRLLDVVAPGTRWMLLADEPGRGVACGSLWTPPFGMARRPAAEFVHLTDPGFAKVGWSLTAEPFGAGHTILVAEMRVQATDPATARRFAMAWSVLAPFAALAQSHVLRAIARHAAHSV